MRLPAPLSRRFWKRRIALVFLAGLGVAAQPGIAWSAAASPDIHAQLQVEQAETQRLMRELLKANPTAETVRAITEDAPEKTLQTVEESRSLWRGGKRPPNFDEFVRIVTQNMADLYPRQRQAFEQSKLITPEQLLNPNLRSVRELVLVWGKGCVAAETLIENAATGETRTAQDWANSGLPLLVRSWDGVKEVLRPSSPVYRKGVAPILRVVLSDGRCFRVTAKHRCLTPSGWGYLGDLSAGSQVLARSLPATSQMPSQLRDRRHTEASGTHDYFEIESITPDGEEDFYDLTVSGTHCYFDAQGVLHHNSGKDWVCALLSAWAFLVLCSLEQDPAIYFAQNDWIKNLGPYSRLSIINVATSEKQAVSVYFKQYFLQFLGHPIFTEIIRETNWGDQAKPPPSEQLVHYRRNPLTKARYESVGVYPMHSRAAGVEGHNCFMWLMDEADALFDASGKSVAEALHSLFRSSAASRFKNWTGFVISYPRLKGGFMLRLKEFGDKMIASRPLSPRWYTDLATTQEVNPNFDLNDPEVQEDFERNPAVARAMYFCQPMETEEAFLEFPELFDVCVDPKRQPIARVGIEHLDLPVRGEDRSNYYLKVTIGDIRRVPGHRYVMTGDAGRKKDSFVMNVWHWDGQSDAFPWLCPECGADIELRSMGAYRQCHRGERKALGVEVECGGCARTPMEIVAPGGAAAAYSGGLAGHGTVLVSGWWERESRDDGSTMMVGGQPLQVAKLYQDLIVRVVPKRATHYNPEHQLGRNRVVFFPATGEVALQACHALEPEAARFDPWQAVDIIDRLRAEWGGDVEEFKMTTPEQLRMYTWSRKMIEGNFVTFLDDSVQTREWKRLQLVNGGTKVDHPKGEGESNDIAFCGAGAIWTCSTRIDNRLSVSWI